MRNLLVSSFALAAVLSFAPQVSAETRGNDLSSAIALCRTTVAEQAGADLDHVRFDQIRQRPRAVLVDVDLWSADGRLTNVRCEVTRGETLAIASITPALNAATAQR